MKTVSFGIENLCVPCHAHCRYCLLSSCGKATGVSYQRGKALSERLFDEAKHQRPDLKLFHYIGYCMDDVHLMDYIDFSKKIDSPSAKFLQLNGLAIRDADETKQLIGQLVSAGIETIDLTFYGTRDYHDRFAGRAGDFDYLLCLLRTANHFRLNVQVSIPVIKENIDQIDDLLRLIRTDTLGGCSLFVPHGKGRGKHLDKLRVEEEDLELLHGESKRFLSPCRTESEWLADIKKNKAERRSLVLALSPGEIDRLEAMSLEEILGELEELDDRYYSMIPCDEDLAIRYGDPHGKRLYRRFRDLQLEWQRRYLDENCLDIWDMNDESHHFSVRT